MGSLTFFVRTVLSFVVWFPTACSTHRGVWQRCRLGFGEFGPDVLLVGNFGDGKINAFNIHSEASLGSLLHRKNQPLEFSGLWSLFFLLTDSISLPGWLTKNMGSSGLFDRQKREMTTSSWQK